MKPKRSHPESDLQTTCKRWFDLQYPKYKNLLFAIPNGGKRSRIEAAIMKGEGVTPGVSDMMLALPVNGWPGAFIEMKYGKNDLSDHQRAWMEIVREQGYATVVIYTLDDFMAFINRYLTEITAQGVEKVVCRHYNLSSHLLHTKSQRRTITEPRFIVMTILRQYHKSNNYGALYFSKDHATCTHAKKTVQNLYETSPGFRSRMQRILGDLFLSETILKDN